MYESNQEIKRGEIWLVDLPEVEGNIQYGRRPVILCSNQRALDCSPIINVIPLTSRLRKVYPMHVLISTNCGLTKQSFALPEQMMPVMKERLIHKIGECDEITMKKVEEGIRIQQGMRGVIDYSYIIEKLTLLNDLNEQIRNGYNTSFNIRMRACFEKDLSKYCFEHGLNYKKLGEYIENGATQTLDNRSLQMLIS